MRVCAKGLERGGVEKGERARSKVEERGGSGRKRGERGGRGEAELVVVGGGVSSRSEEVIGG